MSKCYCFTVLVILEHLEFKNFSCRPTGVRQYFSVFHGPSLLKPFRRPWYSKLAQLTYLLILCFHVEILRKLHKNKRQENIQALLFKISFREIHSVICAVFKYVSFFLFALSLFPFSTFNAFTEPRCTKKNETING